MRSPVFLTSDYYSTDVHSFLNVGACDWRPSVGEEERLVGVPDEVISNGSITVKLMIDDLLAL